MWDRGDNLHSRCTTGANDGADRLTEVVLSDEDIVLDNTKPAKKSKKKGKKTGEKMRKRTGDTRTKKPRK